VHRVLRLLNRETGEYADILPDLGGTVRSLCLTPSGPGAPKISPVSILEADPLEEIIENHWFRGRILFPFNDRIIGARYPFAGRTHTLPVNDPETGDAIHGFLYGRKLSITRRKAGKDTAEIRLEGTIDEAPGYPFRMRISLDYRLEGEGFRIDFRIMNRGQEAAPFSVGWHPYFTLLEAETAGTSSEGISCTRANDLQLRIPGDGYIETDGNQTPSGRILPVEGSPFDFQVFQPVGPNNLDLGFVNPEGWAECRSPDFTLRIEQSELFGYTQVFVPPSRSSIALEPVSAGVDAFNRPKIGLRVLEPGKEETGWVRVRLRRTAAGTFS